MFITARCPQLNIHPCSAYFCNYTLLELHLFIHRIKACEAKKISSSRPSDAHTKDVIIVTWIGSVCDASGFSYQYEPTFWLPHPPHDDTIATNQPDEVQRIVGCIRPCSTCVYNPRNLGIAHEFRLHSRAVSHAHAASSIHVSTFATMSTSAEEQPYLVHNPMCDVCHRINCARCCDASMLQ